MCKRKELRRKEMNNPERHGYLDIPVWEGHAHSLFVAKAERLPFVYDRIMNYYGYTRLTICALMQDSDADDMANNLKSLYVKSKLNTAATPNRVYVAGNIYHYRDGKDSAQGYLRQVKQLAAMGVDGFKMLEGKPGERKLFARRIDDPIFDLMYKFIEDNGYVLTMHVGDPEDNWDITKVSEYARKKGWFYDETYQTMPELRDEVEGILNKFPKLRLNLAHLYFLGFKLEEARALMERHPNVTLDLTPGGEMFVGFTQRHDEWRRFFIDYADRLNYGTDLYNVDIGDEADEVFETKPAAGWRINELRSMLEKTEPFEDRTWGTLIPLGLDRESVEKICHKNYERLIGDARPLNAAVIAQYAADMIDLLEHGFVTTKVSPERDALELENMKVIYEHFSNL